MLKKTLFTVLILASAVTAACQLTTDATTPVVCSSNTLNPDGGKFMNQSYPESQPMLASEQYKTGSFALLVGAGDQFIGAFVAVPGGDAGGEGLSSRCGGA